MGNLAVSAGQKASDLKKEFINKKSEKFEEAPQEELVGGSYLKEDVSDHF